VLRSTLAKGKHSLLLKRQEIEGDIRKQANRFFVKIYQIANAGNHIHIVLRAHKRREFRKFMRIIASLIARKVLGANRNSAVLKDSKRRFWDARPWSRIISWGKHFKNAIAYLKLNSIEIEFHLARYSAREVISKIRLLEGASKLNSTGFT
jgi:REP element-mobilizing transposase RayT